MTARGCYCVGVRRHFVRKSDHSAASFTEKSQFAGGIDAASMSCSAVSAIPLRRAAESIVAKCLAGMLLRSFQRMTAKRPTPQSDARSAWRGQRLMMSGIESCSAMQHLYVTDWQFVKRDNLEIAARIDWSQIGGMSTAPMDHLPDDMLSAMRPEAIAHRLRMIRETAELSKSGMADALGIERTYWSRFEGGKRAITEPVAALLVDRFGVTLDFIFLGRWHTLPFETAQKLRETESRMS